MAGSQLSDEELRQAAAEAGISPMELRHALAERQGNLPDRPDDARSLMGAPTRGISAAKAESQLPVSPTDAVRMVRASIERQVGTTGHNQGDQEADIVDEQNRVTYRIRSQTDGDEGALVRVDVDPTAAKAFRTLSIGGIGGVTVLLFVLGWVLSLTGVWLTAVGLGVVGGLFIARMSARLQRAITQGHAVSAHALMEAEENAARPAAALPPAD